MLAAAALVFATAEGTTSATLQGVLSTQVADAEQGGLAGGLSAVNSAVQLVGPVLAGVLYAQVAPAAPYVLSLVAALLAVGLIRSRLSTNPSPEMSGSLATA